MKLSILIPTIVEREKSFNALVAKLSDQISLNKLDEQIEIVHICDNKEMTIGDKRNKLVKKAIGEFICFIDDDDDISDEYVKLIYGAIIGHPDIDCIGMVGEITTNGRNPKKFIHSIKYNRYFEKDKIYYRPPNHLNPVRREIAIKYEFPPKNFAEDSSYAVRMCKDGVLKKEHFIKKTIYYYKWVPRKSVQRRKKKPVQFPKQQHVANRLKRTVDRAGRIRLRRLRRKGK
jgi:hypothetical protein